jgi:hypothetical protein
MSEKIIFKCQDNNWETKVLTKKEILAQVNHISNHVKILAGYHGMKKI